jgi:hypothetical protein
VLEGRAPPDFEAQFFEDEKLAGFPRYMSLGLQRAFEALAKGKILDFEQPMPFTAVVGENEDGQVSLPIQWLSSEDNVVGVQITDARGRVVAKGKIRHTFYTDTLRQLGAATIALAGEKPIPAELEIDPKLLSGDLRASMLGKDGPIGKSVAIWVMDDVRKRAAAVPNGDPASPRPVCK